MTDMLAIARSGVTAYGKALDVLADNVANAATPGHVRRTVQMTGAMIGGPVTPYELSRNGGNGVTVTAIGRAANLLQIDSLRRSESQVQALSSADYWLTEVQSVISGDGALAEPINEFFSALSGFATTPTTLAERAVVLTTAQTLADRLNTTAASLTRVAADIMENAETEIQELNGLTQALVQINTQIRRATAAGSSTVALADERDRLLAEIATIVPIDVQLDRHGLANVKVGDAGGPYLVQGEQVNAARIRKNPDGAIAVRVGPAGSDAPTTINTGSIHGMSVAGQLAHATMERLDGLADLIADDVNTVQSLGVDLNGNDGTALFSKQKPVVLPKAANGGDARVTASMVDGATPPDLELIYDGTNWLLQRSDLSDSVTGGLPLTLDGVTIDSFGEPRNGDMFEIKLAGGAAGIGVRPIETDELAAAPRFLADVGSTNQGLASIEVQIDANSITPAPNPPFRLETLADGTLDLIDDYDVVIANGAVGEWIAGDGFAVRVTGNPKEFDLFHVQRTGPDSAANQNALALYAIGTNSGPAGTIGDAESRMITGISVPLKQIRSQAEAAIINRNLVAQDLQESSGVDLDQQAAEMVRLQQAFQANSRIIAAAKEIFETILAASR